METAKGKTREEIINKLADKIDAFERYPEPHSQLMAELATLLGTRLGLNEHDIDAIAEAALLHDIGLYAMSPAYHSSNGPLTFEQRLDLWRHPVIGEQQMAKREASRYAQLLVRWHHEWWNGTGYPDTLAFEDIPIGARVLRVVELLCSLIVDRPYRSALSEEQAVAVLKASAGIECDPYLVRALLSLLDELGEDSPVQTSAVDAAPAVSVGPVSEVAPTHATSSVSLHSDSDPLDLDWGSIPSDSRSAAVSGLGDPVIAAPQQAPNFESSSPESPSPGSPAAETPPPNEAPRPANHLLSKTALLAQSKDGPRWDSWSRSRYNAKSLLGFEASVLRQLEFRSIALPLCGTTRLDWYLKTWGKQIFANDPRAWSAALARAIYETRDTLSETHIAGLLQDVYVPRARLTNSDLRQWFGEMDSWWMDNLRRNIDSVEDETLRAQALMIGMQTGDYALSFDEETHDLRLPLTTVFWRLAGRSFAVVGQPANRVFNVSPDEFIRHARADLLFLSLPPAHAHREGSEARSDWRESWVLQAARPSEPLKHLSSMESRHAYLLMIDRLLRPASHVKTWAIGCQDLGLASPQDIIDVIKEHRNVRATYSKDVTQVAGGLRSYIIVADQTGKR